MKRRIEQLEARIVELTRALSQPERSSE
jgi:hypothetical protein